MDPGRTSDLRPRLSYFVCYTARSGSTLLCEALASTGFAGVPDEYFEPMAGGTLQEPVWEALRTGPDVRRYIDTVIACGTTPNGVFGAKLRWPNIRDLETKLRGVLGSEQSGFLESLGGVFPNPRFVWVTRRDKVRQAVSVARALQSGSWTSKHDQARRSRNLTFSFTMVDFALRSIVHQEARWGQFFEKEGIRPITVVYEDLVAGRDTLTATVMDAVGIEVPGQLTLSPPRLTRQADSLSSEWVRRYTRAEEAWHLLRTAGALPRVLLAPSLRRAYIVPALRQLVRRSPHLWQP